MALLTLLLCQTMFYFKKTLLYDFFQLIFAFLNFQLSFQENLTKNCFKIPEPVIKKLSYLYYTMIFIYSRNCYQDVEIIETGMRIKIQAENRQKTNPSNYSLNYFLNQSAFSYLLTLMPKR